MGDAAVDLQPEVMTCYLNLAETVRSFRNALTQSSGPDVPGE
jgi:hypothetical protein